MSQFGEFNAENKLRVPLSSYAAQIIESDCFSFSKKRATLINSIIINSYQTADCSISLRMKEYKKELLDYLTAQKFEEGSAYIDRVIAGRAKEMMTKYARRYPADENWQITLTKRVKELLTEDPYTSEEKYYGQKPGHYVRALVEEYAKKPYSLREEIIFRPFFESINIAIKGEYVLSITNTRGTRFSIKPYKIMTDPLSMYHYLVGYNSDYENSINEIKKISRIVSLRVSRLATVETQYRSSGKLSDKEKAIIVKEIETKGVQFVTSDKKDIEVWMSDSGIKRYKTQAHLRPEPLYINEKDNHIYHFECTDAQILFYFFEFGNDAKIINPPELAELFKQKYKDAYDLYK